MKKSYVTTSAGAFWNFSRQVLSCPTALCYLRCVMLSHSNNTLPLLWSFKDDNSKRIGRVVSSVLRLLKKQYWLDLLFRIPGSVSITEQRNLLPFTGEHLERIRAYDSCHFQHLGYGSQVAEVKNACIEEEENQFEEEANRTRFVTQSANRITYVFHRRTWILEQLFFRI